MASRFFLCPAQIGKAIWMLAFAFNKLPQLCHVCKLPWAAAPSVDQVHSFGHMRLESTNFLTVTQVRITDGHIPSMSFLTMALPFQRAFGLHGTGLHMFFTMVMVIVPGSLSSHFCTLRRKLVHIRLLFDHQLSKQK